MSVNSDSPVPHEPAPRGLWRGASVVALGAYAEGGPFGEAPIYSACRTKGRFRDLSPLFSPPVVVGVTEDLLVLNLRAREFFRCNGLPVRGNGVALPISVGALLKLLAFKVPQMYRREPWGWWAFGEIAVCDVSEAIWLDFCRDDPKDIASEVRQATEQALLRDFT